MTHPLDRAVWHALSTRCAALATGNDRALRLRPDVGLFLATADRSPASLAAAADLIAPGEVVGMVEADAWPLLAGTRRLSEAICVQMVATALPDAPAPPTRIVALADGDAPAMLALATLTRPGPFFAATHRLGGFVGMFAGDDLVAMAGTRLSLPGFVEVSGVCTHPEHRGRGLGAALIRHVAQAILMTGDAPFLTSYATNHAANALYERLGFRTRREVIFTTIERG